MNEPKRRKKPLSKRIAGSLLRSFASRPQGRPKLRPDEVRRILLIRYDRLGDLVITTPLIETISRIAPQAEIDVLGSWRNVALAESDPRINRVLRWDGPPWKRIRTLLECRRRNYDLTIQLLLWRTTLPGLLAGMLTPHGRVVSRDDPNNRALFDHTYKVDSSTHYAEQVYGFLAAAFDLGDSVPEMPLYSVYIPPEARERAGTKLATAGFLPGSYILLNISAGKPERELTAQQIDRLLVGLTEIASREGLRVIVTGSPGRKNDADRAVSHINRGKETSDPASAGTFFGTLPEVMVAIRNARCVVTPDTGTNHLASALGTPTVVFFLRDGRPIGWGPRVPHYRIVHAVEGKDASAVRVEDLLEATASLLAEIRTEHEPTR